MTEFTEVPSPFCGIGTDDLTISADGLALKVLSNGCAVNTPAFEQAIADTVPRIGGREVSLEQAVAKTAEILRGSLQPVIGGCATDVNGMRSVLSLADRCGAVVDQMNFSASRRNYLVMQDSGWMTTTLAEVKNRCDLLLVIGKDLESFLPRFFERYLWTQEAMFLDDTSDREVIYLGRAPSGKAHVAPSGKEARVLTCADTDLPEVVAVLRALIKGRKIEADTVGGIQVSDLQSIAERLQAAKYSVVTWATSSFAFDQAELTVQTVCELVKDLNDQGSRCSGLPLSGKEGDLTASQVAGWTSGYPARISYAKGYPEYDPYLYECQTMIANGEADALLWVHAFNSKAIPPVSDVPTVVVGRSGMLFDKEPEVFIPIGTPGIDHTGHVYRTDSVVAIRLKKLRDSGLPSTAEVLSAIERAL